MIKSHKEIKKGISIYTACMNRQENLKKVLPTWLQHKEVNEIVILDWNSKNSLRPLINSFDDDRIILAETKSYDKWILTKAFNLSAILTSYNKILKVDTDVRIYKDFFIKHNLKHGIFFAGNWKNAKNENERHLNGMNYLFRNDFMKVNGYNEIIQTYGWDDDDFYSRLRSSGLKRQDIDHASIYHIPHKKRVENQFEPLNLGFNIDSYRANINIQYNRILTENLFKYGYNFETDKYSFNKTKDSILLCNIKKSVKTKISSELIVATKIKTMRGYLWEIRHSLPNRFINVLNDNELVFLYDLYFSKVDTPEKSVLLRLLGHLEESSTKVNKNNSDIYKTCSWRIGSYIVKIIVFIFRRHP